MAFIRNKKYMQGYFKCVHSEKYKGDSTNIIYRSSYEFKAMRALDDDPNVIYWQSEETFIPYRNPLDGKIHRYFYDLKVVRKTPEGIKTQIIEIKPAKQTQPPKIQKKRKLLKEDATFLINQAKWEACEAYCQKNNYEFVILTEKELFPK